MSNDALRYDDAQDDAQDYRTCTAEYFIAHYLPPFGAHGVTPVRSVRQRARDEVHTFLAWLHHKRARAYADATRPRRARTQGAQRTHDAPVATCSVAGCTSPVKARGMCNAHWLQESRKRGQRQRRSTKVCKECGAPHYCKDLCCACYRRAMRRTAKLAASEPAGGHD